MQSILSLLLCRSNITSERESRQNIELHFNTQSLAWQRLILQIDVWHHSTLLCFTGEHVTRTHTLIFMWSHDNVRIHLESVPGRPDKCKYSLFGSVLFFTNYWESYSVLQHLNASQCSLTSPHLLSAYSRLIQTLFHETAYCPSRTTRWKMLKLSMKLRRTASSLITTFFTLNVPSWSIVKCANRKCSFNAN